MKLLSACQAVYGSDRGLLDWPSAFTALKGQPLLLLSVHVISQEMLQILYFPNWRSKSTMALITGSSQLSGHSFGYRCRFTHVWATLALDSSFLDLPYISLHQFSATTGSYASAIPVHPTVTPPRMDFTVSTSNLECDSVQGICSCIVFITFVTG